MDRKDPFPVTKEGRSFMPGWQRWPSFSLFWNAKRALRQNKKQKKNNALALCTQESVLFFSDSDLGLPYDSAATPCNTVLVRSIDERIDAVNFTMSGGLFALRVCPKTDQRSIVTWDDWGQHKQGAFSLHFLCASCFQLIEIVGVNTWRSYLREEWHDLKYLLTRPVFTTLSRILISRSLYARDERRVLCANRIDANSVDSQLWCWESTAWPSKTECHVINERETFYASLPQYECK